MWSRTIIQCTIVKTVSLSLAASFLSTLNSLCYLIWLKCKCKCPLQQQNSALNTKISPLWGVSVESTNCLFQCMANLIVIISVFCLIFAQKNFLMLSALLMLTANPTIHQRIVKLYSHRKELKMLALLRTSGWCM